jgi:hypothetical protein
MMRITRDLLLKVARDAVSQRTNADRGLLAAYMHGSMLEDDPLIGGAADIDLFLVHNEAMEGEREITRVMDDIHLDITHHSRIVYRQAKELRLHPWLGPLLFGCKILYDPQHFMDFIQASVRGQFNRPDNVLHRARFLAEHARQMWISLKTESPSPGPECMMLYLRAVEHIANAVASLNGPPLTDRRFLLKFPERAQAIGRPGLYPGLLGLLGGATVDAATLRAWLPAWRAAFEGIPKDHRPPRLDAHRLTYYLYAFETILNTAQNQAILWPLLRTWTQAVSLLPPEAPQVAAWKGICDHLGLLEPAFTERVAALDAYLDLAEETLDVWGRENGA